MCVCVCVCVCARVCAGGGSDYRVCLPHWTPLAAGERERESRHSHSSSVWKRERGGQCCVWAHVSVWTGGMKDPLEKDEWLVGIAQKWSHGEIGQDRTWPTALPALDFYGKTHLCRFIFLRIEEERHHLSTSLNREVNEGLSEDQTLPSGARQWQGAEEMLDLRQRNEETTMVLHLSGWHSLGSPTFFTSGETSALCPLLQISKVTSRGWLLGLNYSHAVWSEERHQEQHW